METTLVNWGQYRETTIVYRGYIGIMEDKLETTLVNWGFIGIMENKMETTIVYWGLYRDSRSFSPASDCNTGGCKQTSEAQRL